MGKLVSCLQISALVLSLVCCPALAEEKPSLRLLNPVFSVDANGTASLPLMLRNESAHPVDLALAVEDFRSKTTGQLLGAKVSIDRSVKTIPPRTAVSVKIDFSNLGEAGESEALLFNDGVAIGTLTAQRLNFPFSISIEGGPNPTIAMSDHSPGRVRLKNDDPFTYVVRWELDLPGEEPLLGGPVTLFAKSTTSLTLTPPRQWLDLGVRGVLRDSLGNAVLGIKYDGLSALNTPAYREFPVTLRLKGVSDNAQRFWAYCLIVVMLGLGGFISLYLNFAVPNHLKRIGFKEQLATLASRISAISTRIDSRLRVSLRLERQRLKSVLNSRRIYSPDLSDVFSRLNSDLGTLTRCVELSEQLDALRRRFSENHGLPTSCVDLIDTNLQNAADALRKNYVGQADLDLAKASLDKADGLFSPPSADGKFAEDLAKRISDIVSILNPNQPLGKLNATITGNLPNIFVANNPAYTQAANITPPLYAVLDNSARRLELWIQYLRERQGQSTPGPAFTAAEQRLWQYLNTNSWNAFYMARIIVKEMQEQIYPEDISDALARQNAVIGMDRQVARVFQPLEFCVCFNQDRYNGTAAAEEFQAIWDFGDGLSEPCWTIWHYYQTEDPVTITAKPLDHNRNAIKDANTGNPVELKRRLSVRSEERNKLGERTRTELLRLMVALFIAIVGLIAGAYEQLAKLDILPGLLAVFVVGFSADSIKNILTPPASKP